MPSADTPTVAILLPCYNEGPVIGEVVRAFRRALPAARIHVYDNNSTDDTVAQAQAAGATVGHETRQGKGHVVRRMFADVEADVYVLADGDGTYDAAQAPAMLAKLLDEQLDMIVGVRVHGADARAYRPGHVFGNRLLTGTVGRLFGSPFRDILSGYRVMSRRFVKTFPALASGFEIETMLTVHALELRLPHAEVDSVYSARSAGTASKLNTVRDGIRILATIVLLYKEIHPFRFFGIGAILMVGAALVAGVPVILDFMRTGLVERVPTAILATGLMVLGAISLTCGLVLDSVARGRREMKRLNYQAASWLRPDSGESR